MEHRRSSRTLLRQDVGLESARVGALAATTHDLSLGGMFVETAPRALPPRTLVTVTLDLPTGGSHRRTFMLEATVVRSDRNGLGLMFLQMEQDEIRALSEALAAQHKSAQH